MATATITATTTSHAGVGMFERFRANRAKRMRAAAIFAELNALSERDLSDIGLSRYDLREVAKKAAVI